MSRIKGRHWSLKIVALLLGVTLWLYVSNEINPTTQQIINRVPLEVRGLAGDVTVLEMPSTIDLRIQGPREKVQQVGVRAVEAYVSLNKGDTGKAKVPVQVKVPEGITIIDISPKEVEVWLERVAEKQVPIALVKSGKPAKGYKLLDAVFDPARVILKGPESLLKTIDKTVVKVNFDDSTDGFHGKLPVQLPTLEGDPLDKNLIEIQPEKVDVFVPVVSDLPNKVVPVKAVIEGQPAPGYIVSNVVPELGTISVFGQRDLVNAINRVDTAPVKIDGATADVYQEAVLALPPGIKAGTTSIKVLVKIIPENL